MIEKVSYLIEEILNYLFFYYRNKTLVFFRVYVSGLVFIMKFLFLKNFINHKHSTENIFSSKRQFYYLITNKY